MANTYFGPWQIASADASKAAPRFTGDLCATVDTAKFYVSTDGSTWTDWPTSGATTETRVSDAVWTAIYMGM